MKRLLIVDDEFGARESLREIFGDTFEVATAENALEGLSYLGKNRVDLIILDLVLPRMGGSLFLKEVRQIFPELPVIVISASSAEEKVKEALHHGAVGFVRKPFDIFELRNLVQQSLTASDLPREREVLGKEVVREFPLLSPIGKAPSFLQMLESVRGMTVGHVLLSGERGAGREFVARLIHSWSQRSAEPFVTVACGQLPGPLLEAELFGSWNNILAKGRRGAVELARGSTLFLEDIHKLPAELQESLERLLVKHEYQRAGSQQIVPSSVSIICTLEGESERALAAGALRPSLLAAFENKMIRVPPLRERPEDIPLLAYHFLQQLRSPLQAQTLDIEPEAMQKLREYRWPGNIRELRNVIERVLLLYNTARHISAASLPQEFSDSSGPPVPRGDFDGAVEAFERGLILDALRDSNGTIKDAAAVLGTTARRLQYRMDRLQIRRNPY